MAISSRARRQRNRRHVMADINVTPMVDVMLVLLIIFMVAAPMLTTGVDVNLPQGQSDALAQETETPLALTVTAEGELFLQDEPITREAMIEEINLIMPERQSDKIYLRADGANSYATVFEIMGELNKAGYSNIGLVGEIPRATEN